MVRFARGSCEGTLCVPGKNLEDPVLSSDGQEQSGQKKKKKKVGGAGISQEGARKTGKSLPRDAPLFLKLSKVQSMQCIVELQ